MTESRHQKSRRENPEAYAARIARYRSSERYRQTRENYKERKNLLARMHKEVPLLLAQGMTPSAIMDHFGVDYQTYKRCAG